MMPLYLCVDCGGSKTSVVICDETGKILGRAYGGPSNFAYLTLEAFISVVSSTVSEALKTCTSPPSTSPIPLPPSFPLAAAWFGVSGVDSPSAVAAITPVLSGVLGIPEGPNLVVGNDTQLLAAPVRSYPDVSQVVTVVAGTGSIAVSFEEIDGRLQELGRIGGWGWILGDEGGGFHVGREAVRQMLFEFDTASVADEPLPYSTLRRRVLDFFRVTIVPEVLPAIHTPDVSPVAASIADTPEYLSMPREKRLSSLAPFVFQSAFEEGDALAMKVLKICAGVLASEISVLLGDRTEALPRLVKAQDAVISFGGSLVGIVAYRNMVLEDLAARGHTFRYVEFVDDAAATGGMGMVKAMTRVG